MGPDPDGQFWYQGLETSLVNNMMQNIEENSLSCITSVTLNFNFDGLPVYNSAKYQFWPILASVKNIPTLPPIIVGIYYGQHKPNVQEYLAEFVKELSTILKNGIKIKSNNQFIAVKIGCFICDSPARAFIKGTVNYNHRQGCTKCIAEGQYFTEGHHMSFPRIDAELRTDVSFRNRLDEDHHKEISPLEELPIDLINDFVVADSLHLLEL
ncbi:PREDICTED: uncharacterized protein LOC105460162, partial [Wasmannia auropunctata]|uniref:uncharacterized protein LOC105460162 n=1 Tax=Wasmannia auropunctata TaxID=64793 RepID=UPI0005EFC40A